MISNKRSAYRVAGVALAAGLMLGLVNPSLWAGSAATAGTRQAHVVAPGETLWGLAERYAGQQDPRNYIYDLEKLNNLGTRPIYPGERLVLP
jgi:LysM repeat protein